jgi:hypothetical protein
MLIPCDAAEVVVNVARCQSRLSFGQYLGSGIYCAPGSESALHGSVRDWVAKATTQMRKVPFMRDIRVVGDGQLLVSSAIPVPPGAAQLFSLPCPPLSQRTRNLPGARTWWPTTPRERKSLWRRRSKAISVYLPERASGMCEGCGSHAPFKKPSGQPYLEPHHIRLSQLSAANPSRRRRSGI